MNQNPVVKNYSYCLMHVPDLVRYGSKPRREIAKDPGLEEQITPFLRSYEEVVCYPPNQTFIGNLTPEELAAMPRPWFVKQPGVDSEALEKNIGKFGEILDQETFLALVKIADALNPPLFEIDSEVANRFRKRLAEHPLLGDFARFPGQGESGSSGHETLESEMALPVFLGKEILGYFHGDRRADARDDENLLAHDLLENLCTKASATLALRWMLKRENITAGQVDFLISCGEEACGDRYQRGGGGMAKAIAEMCGCINASGMDIKNFCAAPASAVVTAASLVKSGIYERVVVVGGGSLAKLGMKFQGFLGHDMKILDDCLAATAILITRDDGKSPIIRLEPGAIGTVPVGASTADESVFRHYLLEPLEKLGLKCTDIDRFAPELQNPEIMEFAGSGDVAQKNYRKIAAMAVRANQLDKSQMEEWIKRIGMVGFAPTQGHIPSAVPYVGHAVEAMRKNEIKRVMFLARASLFLNRCTNLMDGVSFIMERNPGIS